MNPIQWFKKLPAPGKFAVAGVPVAGGAYLLARGHGGVGTPKTSPAVGAASGSYTSNVTTRNTKNITIIHRRNHPAPGKPKPTHHHPARPTHNYGKGISWWRGYIARLNKQNRNAARYMKQARAHHNIKWERSLVASERMHGKEIRRAQWNIKQLQKHKKVHH